MRVSLVAIVLMAAVHVFAEPVPRLTLTLTQEGKVDGLARNTSVHVWLPVPATRPLQKVTPAKMNVPGRMQVDCEPRFGNEIRSFVAPASADGCVAWSCNYEITRLTIPDVDKPVQFPIKDCLRSDRLVPIDGKPLQVFGGDLPVGDAEDKAREIFFTLEDYLKYNAAKPGFGGGDAVWATENHCGDTADFASLFISLARSQKLPALMQTGYELPSSFDGGNLISGVLSGDDCSAWFYNKNGGWRCMDIGRWKHDASSGFGEVDLGYIFMSVGRDLVLDPKQQGPPLNLFLDPYVEVDGKPLEKSHVVKK